jgi:hypothetical protein
VGARPLRPSAAPPSEGEPAAAPAPAHADGGLASFGGPASAGMATWTHPLLAADDSVATVQTQRSASTHAMPVHSASAARAGATGDLAAVQTSRREAPSMALARPQAVVGAPAAIPYGAGATPLAGIAPPARAIVADAAPQVVQTTVAGVQPGPLVVPAATAVVQRADSAPPAAPAEAEGEGRSDGELEELARALFPRLQRQLRMEYVYELEARGLPFSS